MAILETRESPLTREFSIPISVRILQFNRDEMEYVRFLASYSKNNGSKDTNPLRALNQLAQAVLENNGFGQILPKSFNTEYCHVKVLMNNAKNILLDLPPVSDYLQIGQIRGVGYLLMPERLKDESSPLYIPTGSMDTSTLAFKDQLTLADSLVTDTILRKNNNKLYDYLPVLPRIPHALYEVLRVPLVINGNEQIITKQVLIETVNTCQERTGYEGDKSSVVMLRNIIKLMNKRFKLVGVPLTIRNEYGVGYKLALNE